MKDFLIQLAWFVLLYVPCSVATIYPASPVPGSSQSSLFKCERDEAIIVNGFFIITIAIISIIHYRNLPIHVTIWIFATSIVIMERIFKFKNCLDKKWKIIFEFIIILTVIVEPIIWWLLKEHPAP